VDSALGADMKWLPRGVGKLSLMGESHSAVLDAFSCAIIIEFLCVVTSSSIIVLSDRCVLRACAADGGQYVVAGSKSKSNDAILDAAEIENCKNR